MWLICLMLCFLVSVFNVLINFVSEYVVLFKVVGMFVLNLIFINFGLFGVFFNVNVILYVFFGGVVYGFFKILYLLLCFYKFWLIENGLFKLIGIGILFFFV